uniref:Uncharacterized protein n=1 Tax=Panagrolaimus sp. JU765 TaxID=591449 RepID=A0AC34Q3C0_9BILA
MKIFRVALVGIDKVEQLLLPAPKTELNDTVKITGNFVKVGEDFIKFVKPVKADEPDILLVCLPLSEHLDVLFLSETRKKYEKIFSELKDNFQGKDIGLVVIFNAETRRIVNSRGATINEIFPTPVFITVSNGNIDAFYEKLADLIPKTESSVVPVNSRNSFFTIFFRCFEGCGF